MTRKAERPTPWKLLAAIALGCAAAPAAAEAAEQGPVDRLALVGLWSDDGDCGNVTELRGDGTFVAPTGAIGGWAVRGSTLILYGPSGIVSWRIALDARDRLVLTGPDGSVTTSLRCPALPPSAII